MTREETLQKFKHDYCKEFHTEELQYVAERAFQVGLDVADSHPKNPWKDTKKELPEYDKLVIGIFEDGSICGCKCSPEERIWFIDMLVTDPPVYWMLIPEPPKEEEE